MMEYARAVGRQWELNYSVIFCCFFVCLCACFMKSHIKNSDEL